MHSDTTQIVATDRNTALAALNALLRGELSAIETHCQAIRTFENHSPPELIECLQSHVSRSWRLREYILDIHGKPSIRSGTWGAFARMVEGGAAIFGRKAALAVLDAGEGHGLVVYRHKLIDLNSDSRRMVQTELLPEQQKTHDVVRRIYDDYRCM